MVGINDKIGRIVGHVKYVGKNAYGEIIYQHEHDVDLGEHNQVQDNYYDLIAHYMAGSSTSDLISHAECGTGGPVAASANDLQTPHGDARVAIDSKTQGTGGNEHKLTVIFTAGPGVYTCSGSNLTECGLFNHLTAGYMLLYDNTLDFDKGASDTLEVTWTITHATS